MSFYIYTLGCKVNNYESEFIRQLLENKNFVYKCEKPDIIIVNTCTVTNNSDKKCKKLLRSLRKNNKDSILIAIGCMCQYLNGEVDADIVLGTKNKSKIDIYIDKYLKEHKKIVDIYNIDNIDFEDMEIDKYKTHTRAFVKIEDGCNNFCSYCIIPYVRGRVRSKDKDKVIKEVKSLVSNNHKEIVLTGIHTGAYGNEEYGLKDLLKDLLKIEGLYRLRISSIEVMEINDDIISLLKNNKVLVDHLHIPLQSGSDIILNKMNRRYNTSYYSDKINKIRKSRPDINITTDVIVGFNYETDELFKETYEFCKKMKFGKIHVFPYSVRDNTYASKMNNIVNEEVKKERVKQMLCLSKKLQYEYCNKFFNKKMKVLIETYKDGYSYGLTENYIRVKIKGKLKHNEFYDIILTQENVVLNGEI